MKRILHLSDFHITCGMSEPHENTKITTLLSKLKSSNMDFDIIVYTGDLIDSKAIMREIDENSVNDKAAAWDEKAEKAFDLAKKYFTYIKEQLNVNNDNIIICCGNHDVNRNIEDNESIDCKVKEVFSSNKKFAMFDKFCADMQLKECSSKAYFKNIGNLNFFVVNTNITNEKKDGLCLDCNNLKKVFEENKSKLKKSIQNNEHLNIFVAHSPQADYCEYFNFEYAENKYQSGFYDLSKYFDCNFVGDKHSAKITGSEFIMGAPLYEEQITYGIYEILDDLKMVSKKIKYDKGMWNIYESDNVMNAILKESIECLKGSGINFLYGFKNFDMEDAIKNYLGNKSSIRWTRINELFKAYTTLQRPREGQSGIEEKDFDNIIEHIIDIINNSDRTYPIILRGMPKIGKSLFLTIVYIGMMNGYLNNIFKYIPVYFNLDNFVEDKEHCKDQIDKILNVGRVLSQNYNMPICFILDGMRQHIYEENCIEEYLFENINEYTEFNDGDTSFENKIIYSVDIDKEFNGPNTKIHTSKKAQYVLYFNPIMTKKLDDNEKYISFINAFSELYNCGTPDVICENIKKLNFQYIDLNTLINFKENLMISNTSVCKTELYKELAEKLIEKKELNKVSRACYELYYKNQWHKDVVEKYKDLSNNIFYILRKQVNLRNYLIAYNYFVTMENAVEKKREDEIDVLNECFDREIASFITDIIYKENYSSSLIKFNEMYYESLSFKGKSMLTYLLGRLKLADRTLNSILEGQRKVLLKCNEPNGDEQEFFKLVAERSIIISSITGLNEYKSIKSEYINQLISSEKVRKVNRQFYMLYYGDRKSDDVPSNNEIKEGLDFYNVFYILSTRIRGGKETNNSKLIEIELFTLCDLMQQRIDNPKACAWKSNDKIVRSIFYDEKHNKPNSNRAFYILNLMNQMISDYLKEFETSQYNELFKMYLHEKSKEYNAALCQVKDRALNENERYNAAKILEMCSKISKVEKIGWKIRDNITTLDEQLYNSYQNDKSYETVLEHIYECYLIGLLYLPSHGKGDYNKQKILNILLIHDIGECIVGDYPPFYNKIRDIKEKEDIFNKGLYLNGVHEKNADLTGYLELWNEWQTNPSDTNTIIAKDIDKIQMIYKMLTLLMETDINLQEERIKSFYKERKNIKSEEGRNIYDLLIKNNEKFREKIDKLV